jgi:copper oxidase (laccase) domain-containing protein
VGLDVHKQLLESFSESSNGNKAEAYISYLSPTKDKAHVNLGLIIRRQASEFGCDSRRWEISSEDTKTSTDYASFRRDGAGAGRNWSAIYLR